jgi:hypothetical protein
MAIGRTVKFYTFDGTAEPGRTVSDLCGMGILDVESEHGLFQVEGLMKGIKAHGWERASHERM